jgi:hypothetical protein
MRANTGSQHASKASEPPSERREQGVTGDEEADH